MTDEPRLQREQRLIDILQRGLDLHAMALEADLPVLAYLAELLAKRAREELGAAARSSDDDPAAAPPIG